MACAIGTPVLWAEDGSIAYCGDPVVIESAKDAWSEFLYLADRLPTYVIAIGALGGVVMLMFAALLVKQLLS